MPSSFTGVIKELLANEGDTLAVGEVVCTIETEGGTSEELVKKLLLKTTKAAPVEQKTPVTR